MERARRLCAPVAVLAAVIGLLALVPARAAFPGDNGQIAFVSARSGDSEIYLMNADGSGLVRLTQDPAGDGSPAFSPDGRRIVFHSNRPGSNDVFVMNRDGSGETNLSNLGGDDVNPGFSPDGRRVAYSRDAAGNFEIFVMDEDGTNQRNVTNTASVDLEPVFAPGGGQIAFARIDGGTSDVWRINTDGSGLVNLTNNPATDTSPAYSPDGSRIAFHSDRDGNTEIYVMNADGSSPVRLTNDPGQDVTPAFSPDGSRIVWRSDRDGNAEVYVMNADGSGATNLTNNPASDAAPDWGVVPAATPTPTPTATPAATPTPTPAATPAAPLTPTPTATPAASATPTPTPGRTAAPEPTSTPPPSAGPVVGPGDPPPPTATPGPDDEPGGGPGSDPPGDPTPTPSASDPTQATPSAPPAAGSGIRDRTTQSVVRRVENEERSTFARAFVRPDDLRLSAEDLVRSFGIALLLVALLGFPAALFNSTVKENRDQIQRFFAPLVGALQGLAGGRAQRLLGLVATSVIAGTLIYVFLDPGFPTGPGSGAFAVGMLLGFAAVVANLMLTSRAFLRRVAPGCPSGWRVYPAQILLSLACVAVSRAASFAPGLIMGASGGDECPRLDARHVGPRVAVLCVSLATVSLAAWAVSIPVAGAAAEPGAGFAVLVADTALSVVAVAGMETLVFTLVPLAFLDGYPLYKWRPGVWFCLWAAGLAWFSLVVINPALGDYDGNASRSWVTTLFVAEGAIAFGLWWFFVRRGRQTQRAMTPGLN